MTDNYKHIFIGGYADTLLYTTPQRPRGGSNIPPRDKEAHLNLLRRKLDRLWSATESEREEISAISMQAKEGTYVEFKSKAGYDLVTKSLEDLRSDVRLLNIKVESVGEDDSKVTIATVYLPAGKEGFFLKKINDYAEKNRNKNLVDSIEDINLAVVSSFWQDDRSLMPRESKRWCEVWLRSSDGVSEDVESRFRALCGTTEIECKNGSLNFPERRVVLCKVTESDLHKFLMLSPDIAEFRLSKDAAGFWMELPNEEQSEWVQNLLDRTIVNDNSSVSVCVLDTGVNYSHPLLSASINADNCYSYNPSWGVSDSEGHGTAMSGVALYGDLQNALLSSGEIEISHSLESVKIIPNNGSHHDPELWGYITQQSVSYAEIGAPDKTRIACMAVTSDDGRDRGRPSSWSAAVDAAASGYEDDEAIKRLFIVSAGNVRSSSEWLKYPASNYTYSVHDPGQSWNALTVGAITEKININGEGYGEYTAVAPYGGLSPYSTTSLTWERKWPIKPEIVLEGGNVGKTGAEDFASPLEDLSVLTTHHDYTSRHFSTVWATSAATAEASRMAAVIQSLYPQAWPETIRGLMIHSAIWTDEMKRQFGINEASSKGDYAKLLRVFGYGTPNISAATKCASNSLTLIAQEKIQPYDRKEATGTYGTKDMHVYELPWPKEILLGLGSAQVQMKVTLSYFVEPGPGEIGWKDRYRYASHGLRFSLNNPYETRNDFVRRINAAVRDEEDDIDTSSNSERWLLGRSRNVGSIHSDIWAGSAADIATCNLVGIYPVIGWWRERRHLNRWRDKARYSLIISLHTDEQDVDIYTSVALAVQPPIVVGT